MTRGVRPPNIEGEGKMWVWANSFLARIPSCVVNHPNFPFKKGDITRVEIDVENERIIISKAIRKLKNEDLL